MPPNDCAPYTPVASVGPYVLKKVGAGEAGVVVGCGATGPKFPVFQIFV